SCSFLTLFSILHSFIHLSHFYTLSLHDALPIFMLAVDIDQHLTQRAQLLQGYRLTVDVCLGFAIAIDDATQQAFMRCFFQLQVIDRKSTRLNSSHVKISYAVFCLKKKTLQLIL